MWTLSIAAVVTYCVTGMPSAETIGAPPSLVCCPGEECIRFTPTGHCLQCRKIIGAQASSLDSGPDEVAKRED